MFLGKRNGSCYHVLTEADFHEANGGKEPGLFDRNCKESDSTIRSGTFADGFLVSAHALVVYDACLLETERRNRCLIFAPIRR